MKSRLFDHIDLRARDVDRTQKFYVPLLKALGFTEGLNSQQSQSNV